MNQILHIFAKDMRRFWGEIVLSLAITTVLVCIGAYLWSDFVDSHGQILALLAYLVAILVPVSWWILITRVIHAERLVGDTQFWITRPYTWNSLLAAKLLFLVVFVYLPFFIAQLLLLAEAGFAPQHYLAGLLFNLLLLTGTAILPLASIATVTSNFARTTLTLLGIFLGFIALASVSLLGFTNRDVGVDSRVGSRLCLALAVVAFSVAIAVQYALRKVWLSRGILIALPVLLFATTFFASRYDQAQMDRTYVATQAPAPIQLLFSPRTGISSKYSFQASSAMIPLEVPLAESGVAEGYAVIPDAVRVDIKAPDGSHWESDWQGGGMYKFLPGEAHFGAAFSMPMAVFQKFQSMPLSVHLVFAITEVQAGKATVIPMPDQRFPVPDFGVCSPTEGWSPGIGQATGIHCVSALREPQLTYISTRWSDGPCSGSPVGPDSGVLGTAWAGSLDREPAQLSLTSVVELHFNLSNNQRTEKDNNQPRYLCPGTPITFTPYTRVGRTQASVDVQGFYLPKFSVAGNMITITTTTSPE